LRPLSVRPMAALLFQIPTCVGVFCTTNPRLLHLSSEAINYPIALVCDNIAFFSSFPLNSDDLRSLRSLRQPPSDSAPISAPLPIPLSPSPSPMTCVSCYGLFLVFTDLFPVFPCACIILHSLLDSLR